jgi:poly(3-hydroxyalkanoate) depolymerase
MNPTVVRTINVDGQTLRVGVRRGVGRPLLLFNGIGANMDLLEPITRALDGLETIVFDMPGVGGSAPCMLPYRMRRLTDLATRMLQHLGYHGAVDALGVSWGGLVAQQFARSHPAHCRRLVLAATTPGVLMVPGSPFVLTKMLNPRRYRDPEYLSRIAPDLYGGKARRDKHLVQQHAALLAAPHWRGYLYQQLALWGWSSLPWLRLLRQPTLVMAGSDDPLVPLANARLLAHLIPKARLEIFDDGHLFLMSSAERVAPVVREFLSAPC